MKPVTKLVVAILPVLLIIGCGSKEVKDDATDGENIVVEGGVSTGDAMGGTRLGSDIDSGVGSGSDVIADSDSLDSALLEERKVYFDFDRSEITGESQDILKAHADYLIVNPSASVMIEGNADERGTREYNMALGERRAYSVLQFLTLQGVSKSQLSTVSFGEERPAVEGHDESAWKYNRRAELVYSE